jgi:hypothetical protein
VAKYIGDSLTNQEYWLLEINNIHEDHRIDEAEIQSKRWFDYRRITSAQATYLFAHLYSQIYIEFYKRTVDIRTVDTARAFTPDDIFQSKDLTSLWLARQAADQIGCKYEFYLRVVFEIFISRGWKHLPRPNQIYSEELSIDISRLWEKRCIDILQIADNPFYLESSYISHPDQNNYYEWLASHIKLKEQKHFILSGVMKQKILPYELALQFFGVDTCKRALMS